MSDRTGTRLTIPVAAEGGASRLLTVTESFDEVMDRVAPLNGAPSSALEHRQRSVYHDLDGRRVYAQPQAIALVEESVHEDDPA